MKLTTADFQDRDIETLEIVVDLLKRQDPSINLKKYLRLCIVQYTDAVLTQLKREQEKLNEAAKSGTGTESGIDTGEGKAV